MTTGQKAAAARTAPRKDDDKAQRAGNLQPGTPADAVPGPIRTQEEIEQERRLAQPHQAHGPGSGSRLVHAATPAEGKKPGQVKEANLAELYDTDDASTIVTLKKDVHEEVPAPGAPGRTVKFLLFHAGQRVPRSVIDRHVAAQRASKRAAGDDGDGEDETGS